MIDRQFVKVYNMLGVAVSDMHRMHWDAFSPLRLDGFHSLLRHDSEGSSEWVSKCLNTLSEDSPVLELSQIAKNSNCVKTMDSSSLNA